MEDQTKERLYQLRLLAAVESDPGIAWAQVNFLLEIRNEDRHWIRALC
jgi:hypothetical protein